MENSNQSPHVSPLIARAFDPEVFRQSGHALVTQLAEHLEGITHSAKAVLNWNTPSENLAAARQIASKSTELTASDRQGEQPEAFASRALQLAETILERQHNLHDPRYIGHQVPPPVPIAALFEAISALSNQGMAVYEMGPWASAVEALMVELLGRKIGFSDGEFSGVVTSGGSLANLTALLTARNVAMANAWQAGMNHPANKKPVLITHDEVHYSIDRAAGVIGIGADQVIRCKVDDKQRMDVVDLERLIGEMKAAGRPIVAVVAAACSTRTGAFDPLNAVADICEANGVWLHVDAAHGGAACCSAKYRHLIDGLSRADSVIMDAHKMLYAPALCTFIFYKNKAHRFSAFQQDASYLFNDDVSAEFESGLATIECTKRAAVYGLWGTWMLFGEQLFCDLVGAAFDLARQFFVMLSEANDFEPLHDPQSNIQVFRYVPESMKQASPEAIGKFQLELRKRLIRSGDYYIVTCEDEGIPALRITVINPLTTTITLTGLMDAIRETGASIPSIV